MDELRGLPHNTEAEQSVIGSMLLDPRCIPTVVERLDSEDFYLPAHQDIFDAIYAMFARNAAFDPVTLMDEMRGRGTFDESSTADYISRLLDVTPTSAHAAQYSDIVRRMSLLRKLDNIAGEISSQAREPGVEADTVLDAAEQSIFDLRQGREVTSLYKIPVVLMEVYQNIREISEAGGKLPGIPSGIPDLDEIIGGLLNSSFIIVASRPGVGKTSFLLGLGLSAARAVRKSVVFFSLEMSREQLVSRLLSNESGVNSKKLLTGDLNPNDWMRIGEAASSLSQLPYLFDDNPVISVEQMKAKCRRVPNLGLVIIDYLQLMHGSKKRYDNRTTEVGDISRNLKIMAKELGVPVLCASQLSRENEKRGDKRPMLSDLRESGAIEQDADVVMFLHREGIYSDEVDKSAAELNVAKNRHGETRKIDLHWSGDTTTFTSADHGYYDG